VGEEIGQRSFLHGSLGSLQGRRETGKRNEKTNCNSRPQTYRKDLRRYQKLSKRTGDKNAAHVRPCGTSIKREWRSENDGKQGRGGNGSHLKGNAEKKGKTGLVWSRKLTKKTKGLQVKKNKYLRRSTRTGVLCG